MDCELSEVLEIKVWMQKGSVLSPYLFAVVVYVVTEYAREGALSGLLFADDFVLMSETIVRLRNKFLNGRRLLRARVCGGITKDGMSKSKVDQCGVCLEIKG